MPLHLETVDVVAELKNFRSVLIVSCPVCPPVSLATDKNAPFKEPLRHGIKTGVYEEHIGEIRESLTRHGIRSRVFTSYLPCAAACLWTKGQRNRLLNRARDYEAALVMGCESARYTVQQALKDTDCAIVQGMQLVGITNATLRFRFPATVRLEEPARVRADERRADS